MSGYRQRWQRIIRAAGSSVALALSLVAPAAAQDRLMPTRDPTQPIPANLLVAFPDGTRQAVTDMALDIIGWGRSAQTDLFAPDVKNRPPFDAVFAAQLLVVAGGRLLRDGFGVCSAWESGVSVCTVECDGGHFLLERVEAGTPEVAAMAVTLRFGPIPDIVANGSGAVRVGDCGGDAGAVMELQDGGEARVRFLPYRAY